MLRIVHYINQFYAGIGGEEQAGIALRKFDYPVGPSILLQKVVGENAKVIATITCGDNYAGENSERFGREIIELITPLKPDLVISGPAFNAGRYGLACGLVSTKVQDDLGIPAVTAMFPENAGREVYGHSIVAVPCGKNPKGMEDVLRKMYEIGVKLCDGTELGPAIEEGYLPRGVRKNRVDSLPAAARAVKMLLAKMNGQQGVSELEMPKRAVGKPAPALRDLSLSKIAMVTSGGVVPAGNPDRIPTGRSKQPFRYDISDLDTLPKGKFEAYHFGYDPQYVNEDPNRGLPLDVLRDMEKEGKIAVLHNEFYTVAGAGSYVEDCTKIGTQIAKEFKDSKVDGVVLTST